MMNSCELRIGNLFHPISRKSHVHMTATGIFMKVVEVHSFNVMAVHADENPAQVNPWLELPLYDLSPIPITPEILEKLGMKKRFPDSETCNIWDNVEKLPTRGGSLCLALLNDGWHYLGCPGAQLFHNIHQLQNLYFALTGTELTIKQLYDGQR